MVKFYIRQITDGKMEASEAPKKWKTLIEKEIKGKK